MHFGVKLSVKKKEMKLVNGFGGSAELKRLQLEVIAKFCERRTFLAEFGNKLFTFLTICAIMWRKFTGPVRLNFVNLMRKGRTFRRSHGYGNDDSGYSREIRI